MLSPSLAGALELLASRFPPGASSGDAPYTHAGEEAGVVIRGKLELWVDGKVVPARRPATASASPARSRTAIAIPDTEEAEVIWAITPPSY